MAESSPNNELTKHVGSCHCGRVKFEFLGSADLHVLKCNCSACNRTKFEHVIIPKSQFKLLAGENALTDYRFGTQTANHLFCKVCGVKSFYVPRSHPDSYSVNLRCVEQHTVGSTTVEHFDGKNWEQARERLHDGN